MENKVQYGLSKAHYAPLKVSEGGVITFEKPIPLLGAVSIELSPTGDKSVKYADNIPFYTMFANNGYEANLVLTNIPDDFAAYALGEEKEVESGIITEKADSKNGEFALLFQFEGDVKATRHVLYKCTCSRPTIASQTTEESVEFGESELTLTVSPIELDGELIVKRKTSTTTPEDAYNKWYTEVFRKTVPGV